MFLQPEGPRAERLKKSNEMKENWARSVIGARVDRGRGERRRSFLSVLLALWPCVDVPIHTVHALHKILRAQRSGTRDADSVSNGDLLEYNC